MTAPSAVRIATAGWSIPRAVATAFPGEDGQLARYARVLNGVEINSTFYRAPRLETLRRWAADTSKDFRFALKVPRTVSHEKRLRHVEAELDAFLVHATQLGAKLGPLLLQLPPSLPFDDASAGGVFSRLKSAGAPVACEPRHASWFTPEVDAWLREAGVARVAADPALHPGAGEPGGWRGLSYWRLHGSPRTYYSAYGEARVDELARRIREDPTETAWCVFDNTAAGAAIEDALALARKLAAPNHLPPREE